MFYLTTYLYLLIKIMTITPYRKNTCIKQDPINLADIDIEIDDNFEIDTDLETEIDEWDGHINLNIDMDIFDEINLFFN